MSKWDARFLNLADLVASWSKDAGTQVGAVLVDEKHRVISLGFNGLPRRVLDHAAHPLTRDEKLRRTIHAEENALLFAAKHVEGCTAYVTHPPCGRCAAKLIQAGVARIVAQRPQSGFSARWAEDMASAEQMYQEAGIQFELLDANDHASPGCTSSERSGQTAGNSSRGWHQYELEGL